MPTDPFLAATPREGTKRLSSLATLGVVLMVPAVLGASLYLLYALGQALHWALGVPTWLAIVLYLVLVLELRVAGEPTPKGLLPRWARRLVLWSGLALLLVWSWQLEHPSFWVALAMLGFSRLFALWARRRRARMASVKAAEHP